MFDSNYFLFFVRCLRRFKLRNMLNKNSKIIGYIIRAGSAITSLKMFLHFQINEKHKTKIENDNKFLLSRSQLLMTAYSVIWYFRCTCINQRTNNNNKYKCHLCVDDLKLFCSSRICE